MKYILHIGKIKLSLFIAALIIVTASFYIFHTIIKNLYAEERTKVEIWAEAMSALNNADENTDLNLVLKIINKNNTIPIIVLNSKGKVQTYRNMKLQRNNKNQLITRARQLKKQGKYIKISYDANNAVDYIEVCYDDSLILKYLYYYPYIQILPVLVFVLIVIWVIFVNKRAEQNKIWVGLSKETAHQLGTPLSSLLAWIDILRETYPKDNIVNEMQKDIDRLQLIASRFSKIGSIPQLKPSNINNVIKHVSGYIERRSPNNIEITNKFDEKNIIA